jgi:hypothetical protein
LSEYVVLVLYFGHNLSAMEVKEDNLAAFQHHILARQLCSSCTSLFVFLVGADVRAALGGAVGGRSELARSDLAPKSAQKCVQTPTGVHPD